MNSDTETVKNLLSHLDEEYKSGSISEGTYKELRTTYENELKRYAPQENESAPEKKEPLHVSQDIKDLKAKLNSEYTGEPTKLISAEDKINIPNVVKKDSSNIKKIEPGKLEELGLIKRLFKHSEKKVKSDAKNESPQINDVEPDKSEVVKNEGSLPLTENSKEIIEKTPQASEQSLVQAVNLAEQQSTATTLEIPKVSELSTSQAIEGNATALEEPEVHQDVKSGIEKVETDTVQDSSNEAVQPNVGEESQTVVKDEKPKGEGFLNKIFGKKDKDDNKKDEKSEEQSPVEEEKKLDETVPAQETEAVQEMAPVQETSSPSEAVESSHDAAKDNLGMEIEKIKIIIDSIRDTKKASDETLQSVFESIGEIRSLSFQTDASLKENASKLERVEEEINEINPKAFTKKINDINSTIEKHGMFLEKLDAKSGDLSEKVNQTYTLLKTIGGIENLININKELQNKINDIHEATKYIERISLKAEKTYMDLNDRLNEFVLYRSKLEMVEDASKDMAKSIDRINVGLENYMTKKDLDAMNAQIALMQGQLSELNKALPMLQMKMPENISLLRNEKDDIAMFMTSLEEQMNQGKIPRKEFEKIKEKNNAKLVELDDKLKREWEKVSKLIPGGEGKEPTVEVKEKSVEKQEPKPDIKPELKVEPSKVEIKPVEPVKEDVKNEAHEEDHKKVEHHKTEHHKTEHHRTEHKKIEPSHADHAKEHEEKKETHHKTEKATHKKKEQHHDEHSHSKSE
jgi:hypothetical protein